MDAAPRKRQKDRMGSKINTIRAIILSIVLFVFSDSTGGWFVQDKYQIHWLFSVLIWVISLTTGVTLFFCFHKPEKKYARMGLAILYFIVFVVLLSVTGFYSFSRNGGFYLGYKLSVTLMPLLGIAIEYWFDKAVKWYGSLLKRIFKLNSIRHPLFAIGMLFPIALAILIFMGSYRFAGHLAEFENDFAQLLTEGEINHNTDHKEPSRPYSTLFADLNDVQLEAAKKNGLRKIASISEAEENRQLKKISSCSFYHIQDLTHSEPYLVPKAARLLEDMGKAFQDSLFNRGYSRNHRFTVTSLLRTPDTIKKLQKTNQNSTTNSCHCYGTTFDISYRTFHTPMKGKKASDEKMNQVLMQVAHDMREQGRCLVKYEKQQPCLHITVR